MGRDAGEAGQGLEVGADGSGDAVDVAQREGDLDVAAFVEILEGDREGLEGFAPQLVDAFFAGAVQHEAPEAERLLQTSAAFAHQRVVGLDFDADGLQFDQLGEDVGGPVEEGAGEHGALDPAPLGFGFGFGFVALAGFVEAAAGDVEVVFDVVEEAPISTAPNGPSPAIIGRVFFGCPIAIMSPIPVSPIAM